MNKLLLTLSVFILSLSAFSQSNVNADCINAIPLCTTPNFTFYSTSGPGSITDFTIGSTISNPVNNPFPPHSGCLKSGELNPQWLLITVGNAGLLEFVFGAAGSPNPQAGCYDWIMWPYSPSTCANILNNTLPPIRCNWNGPCSGGTGVASASNVAVIGGSANNFEPPLPVNACQQFIICISNYSGVNTLVSFQSLGSASLSCNPNCNPNYAICAGSSATIVPVNFAALANPVFSMQPGGATNTTGSFVVTPSVTSSYTTFITGTNQLNAVQTITAVSNVTVLVQPSSVPTLTQTTCTNSLTSIKLNPTFVPYIPAAPGYTITWSPIPNGILSQQQNSVTAFVSPGTYTATIVASGGCSATTSFVVNPPPAPALIDLSPLNTSYTLTCAVPIITITSLDAASTYTWTNGLIAPIVGQQAVLTFTSAGTWTIYAVNQLSGCTATKTLVVNQNTLAPSAVLSPSIQNITCNISSITTITSSAIPIVNVSHQFISPQGGIYTANTATASYLPGGVGTYTHCAINNDNSCGTCGTFVVVSSQGFPTFSVVSAQNFTLGCNSTSLASINIINANTDPPGGAVSYTLIGPITSTAVSSGNLSQQSTYTVNVPGTWTLVTKDNTSFCETRVPVSVLQNTFAPDITALVPRQILDCNFPRTTLKGQSLTNNVKQSWSFPGTPGTQPGDTITVYANFLAPSNSVVANYTLTITDNSSTCKSTSLVPIYQNVFPPKAVITNGGVSAISCKTQTLYLTNQSSTGIPGSTGFSTVAPVIALLWDGPSPQVQVQVSSTYFGWMPGEYTMTAQDLNNGCKSKAVVKIDEQRIYPIVNNPISPPPFVLDCGISSVKISPIITSPSSAYSYSWTSPVGATVSGVDSGTLTTNTIGMYRILTTNTVNGCSVEGLVTVKNGTLTANFEPGPRIGFAPLLVTFSNTSISSSGNESITAYWSFGNGTRSITTFPLIETSANYAHAGSYSVTLYAQKGSCLDTVRKAILVDLASDLEIPNVFSPNGDGINDQFFLKAANLKEIRMTIIDRWGMDTFSCESGTGNCTWDGKNGKGSEAAEGLYYYTITAKGADGATFVRHGTICLLR